MRSEVISDDGISEARWISMFLFLSEPDCNVHSHFDWAAIDGGRTELPLLESIDRDCSKRPSECLNASTNFGSAVLQDHRIQHDGAVLRRSLAWVMRLDSMN